MCRWRGGLCEGRVVITIIILATVAGALLPCCPILSVCSLFVCFSVLCTSVPSPHGLHFSSCVDQLTVSCFRDGRGFSAKCSWRGGVYGFHHVVSMISVVLSWTLDADLFLKYTLFLGITTIAPCSSWKERVNVQSHPGFPCSASPYLFLTCF